MIAAVRGLLRHRPARYTLIGGLCAATNMVLLVLGDRLGLGYGALVVFCWAVVGSLAYALHARFTFAVAHGLAAYGRFMAGLALGVPVSWALLWLGGRVLGLPMRFNAPLNAVLMFAYNYLAAKIAILWRDKA